VAPRMTPNDDEPPSQLHSVDTAEFFFPGSGVSALLIHGLTGTPYEMRYLGERLAAAGVRVRGVRLAGHADSPEALGATTQDNWYESVVKAFEELRGYGDPNVVVGLSAGAVLGARLAADQRDDVSALAMLAPALFLSTPTMLALKAVSILGPLAHRIYLRSDSGSDIHDQSARLIHPSVRLMPLSAPVELMKLSALVRAEKLSHITQPTLVMHSRNDHTCPCAKNVDYLMEHLGTPHKRAVLLDESFHVITVDSDKDHVAAEVIEFTTAMRAMHRKAG